MIRVSRTVSSVSTASKPGVKSGTITGAKIATIDRERDEQQQHQVEHASRRRATRDPPRCGEQAGEDRDQRRCQARRPQRAGRSRRADGTRRSRRPARPTRRTAGDDDQAHPAQDARHEEGRGDDHSGPRQSARGHGSGVSSGCLALERGCARGTRCAAVPAKRACRPASWPGSRGRAAPARRAGRRRLRAGGWRTSGAACAARRRSATPAARNSRSMPVAHAAHTEWRRRGR